MGIVHKGEFAKQECLFDLVSQFSISKESAIALALSYFILRLAPRTWPILSTDQMRPVHSRFSRFSSSLVVLQLFDSNTDGRANK